jgi:folate-dependent phosphoribosylglycinamide formyltransferase PurN
VADDPLRVVLFGSGGMPEHAVKLFLHRIEREPRIRLVGAYFQATGRGPAPVVRDLWNRRGALAIPLLAALVGHAVVRYLVRPLAAIELKRTFRQLEPRFRYVPDIHAEEVLEQVRALQPDLGLIYGSPILKPELFTIPRHGTLGIHHGKLPEYRGKKTVFWAMYNGERTAGVTIQRVNAGLDTGEIVQEGEVPIGRRSRRAVWRELEQLGLDLYVRAILEVAAGNAVFRPFPGRRGKLYRDPGVGDLVRFWARRVRILAGIE